MTELEYVRNNLDGPLHIPFGKVMIGFRSGVSSLEPAVLSRLTGGFDSNGKAKGGRAAEYFNAPHPQLQRAHKPIDGDPCHVTKVVPGVRRSRGGQRQDKERAEMVSLREQVAELKGIIQGSAEPSEPLLDPSDYTIDDLADAIEGLDADELFGVLKLERTRSGGARAGAEKLLLDAI